MSTLNFDLSAFGAERNGVKTQTTTPILEVKGSINRFGVNLAAIKAMGIGDFANVVLLENSNPECPLGERYVAVICNGEDKEMALPGAKIVRKEDEGELGAGTFQYAPTWSKIQSNSLNVMSNEDLFMAGILIKNDKNKYAGVKSINFIPKLVAENVDVEDLGYMPVFAGYEGFSVNMYALTNPVEEPYIARTVTNTKPRKSKALAEVDEIEDNDEAVVVE